jgi:uncharacterized LabA/DUF88 family protein
MLRTYVFIDGGHVREGLSRIDVDWREINLGTVAFLIPNWIQRKWRNEDIGRDRIFVYDAAPEDEAVPASEVDRWLRRNDDQLDVHVRYGRLAGEPSSNRRRQKAVDVQLAVDALNYAANDLYDVCVLVTGDGDFAPLAEAVRERGPLVAVCAFQFSLSDELRRQADRVGYLPVDPNAWSWRLPPEPTG